MRRCSVCGKEKREDEFTYTGYVRKRDGQRTRKRYCKECAAKMTQVWSAQNPEKVARCSFEWRAKNRFRHTANVHRRGKYPCTATASEIESAFTGYCNICGKAEVEERLHMDHDHATGKFRGWLCSACNHGIGRFQDSPRLLMEAITYLTKPRQQQ